MRPTRRKTLISADRFPQRLQSSLIFHELEPRHLFAADLTNHSLNGIGSCDVSAILSGGVFESAAISGPLTANESSTGNSVVSDSPGENPNTLDDDQVQINDSGPVGAQRPSNEICHDDSVIGDLLANSAANFVGLSRSQNFGFDTNKSSDVLLLSSSISAFASALWPNSSMPAISQSVGNSFAAKGNFGVEADHRSANLTRYSVRTDTSISITLLADGGLPNSDHSVLLEPLSWTDSIEDSTLSRAPSSVELHASRDAYFSDLEMLQVRRPSTFQNKVVVPSSGQIESHQIFVVCDSSFTKTLGAAPADTSHHFHSYSFDQGAMVTLALQLIQQELQTVVLAFDAGTNGTLAVETTADRQNCRIETTSITDMTIVDGDPTESAARPKRSELGRMASAATATYFCIVCGFRRERTHAESRSEWTMMAVPDQDEPQDPPIEGD